MLDNLIEEFWRRNELPKSDDAHMVNDDTQIGIEFALEEVFKNSQVINNEAISYLFDNHREVYDEFYKRLTLK